MRIGAHMSVAGGVSKAVARARLHGCEALQIFTKNGSQWKGKPLDPAEVTAFHSALAHASGNRRMAAALCDLIGQADRLVRVSVANVKGHDPARLVAEHVALIEAMQRRDGRGAARIIKAHIAQTEKRVLPALKRNAVIVDGREA